MIKKKKFDDTLEVVKQTVCRTIKIGVGTMAMDFAVGERDSPRVKLGDVLPVWH